MAPAAPGPRLRQPRWGRPAGSGAAGGRRRAVAGRGTARLPGRARVVRRQDQRAPRRPDPRGPTRRASLTKSAGVPTLLHLQHLGPVLGRFPVAPPGVAFVVVGDCTRDPHSRNRTWCGGRSLERWRHAVPTARRRASTGPRPSQGRRATPASHAGSHPCPTATSCGQASAFPADTRARTDHQATPVAAHRAPTDQAVLRRPHWSARSQAPSGNCICIDPVTQDRVA